MSSIFPGIFCKPEHCKLLLVTGVARMDSVPWLYKEYDVFTRIS